MKKSNLYTKSCVSGLKQKLVWLLLWPLLGFAQQFPVRLTPIVFPPYSQRLSTYATTTEMKMQLQLLMTDLNEPQHQVGLKFSLESGFGNVMAQSNDFVLGFQPITLFGGATQTLTNFDLRPLFELQNLSGMNPTNLRSSASSRAVSLLFSGL